MVQSSGNCSEREGRNNKMKKKWMGCFFAGIFSLLLVVPVMASETVSRSYRFTTQDKQEKHDEEFEQQITEDGKLYELEDIHYEIQSKKPVMMEKEVEKVVETDYMSVDTEYHPEPQITEDGIVYEVKETSAMPEEAYTQAVTGYTDYSYPVTADNVPKTKDVTVQDSRTGEEVSVSCSLTSVERLADGVWENSHINITFISYDAEVFIWQGLNVSADENQPLKGYEAELLESVGADATTTTIKDIAWAGDPYYDASGVLCRDAIAYTQKYVNYYRANYAGTYQDLPGVRYRVVYKGTEQVASDTDYIYEIEAVASYNRVKEKVPVAVYIMTGVGILLFAVLVVLILYIFAKKKKEGTTNSTLKEGKKRRKSI